MPLLNAKWALREIRDVEAFVWAIVGRSKLQSSRDELQDLAAYLIAECWLLGERYEPGGIKFSTWATTTLRLRTIDWMRQRRGRTRWAFAGHVHERERAPVDSLDDRRERGLDEPVTGGMLDRGRDSFAADMRALRDRARAPSGYNPRVDSGTARRVA